MTRSLPFLLLLGCTWVSSQEHADRVARLDRDGDGFLDADLGGDDCDDSDPTVSPDADERCNGLDDDCDGLVDLDDDSLVDAVAGYPDEDGDGFGADSDAPVQTCDVGRSGLVDTTGDCDDEDASVYPGAPDVCPGYGQTDRDCADRDVPCFIEAAWLDPADTLPDGVWASAVTGWGDGQAFVALGDTSLRVWPLPAGPRSAWTGSLDLDVPSDDISVLAQGGPGPLLGLPDVGKGLLWQLGPDVTEPLVSTYSRGGRSGFGRQAAWLSTGDGWVQLGTVQKNNGAAILLFGPPGGVFGGDTDLLGGVPASLVAGSEASNQVLAVGDPALSTGGRIAVARSSGVPSRLDLQISGAAGEGLGSHLALGDLNADGALDLVVAGTAGVWCWLGPLGPGVRTTADAAWFEPTPSAPASLVVADLNADGLADVAYGLPLEGLSSGEGYVLLSGDQLAGRDPVGRVRIVGAAAGGQLGSTLDVADSDGDGALDLIMGQPGSGGLYVLPGRTLPPRR